ncbi:MAG: response regulator [Candidatus Omnitrophota bacterium]
MTDIQKNVKILLVDDEPLIRKIFVQALSKEYETVEAGNSEQALELLESEKPNIVLLDIYMPGMNGIETLKKIKEIDDKIIVIMVSAHGTNSMTSKAMELGAYDFITKPFNLDRLKTLIKSVV